MDAVLNEIVELYFEGYELEEILENYKEGQKRYVKERIERMYENWQRRNWVDIEMLEYGDRLELRNGNTCVYIRKELDVTDKLITQELNIVNVFTGEEISINCYRDDLTHDTDNSLDIVKFAN